MKELLSRKRKLKYDENITMEEECNAITQWKLPLKLTDPSRFTIPCSIGSLTICHGLCDLGSSINLMSISMMRKLNYGKPKLTHMTLTLANRSITYPCRVLEDILVRVDNLLFPAYFVIHDMPKDSKTPLTLGIPLLATSRSLTDMD